MPSRRKPPPDSSATRRLVRAAIAQFTRFGYAGASVRGIVEEAGVTKPVLYYHFGSKEGMYLASVQQLLVAFEDRLRSSQEGGGDVRTRILRICGSLYELAESQIPLVRLLYAVYYGPPQGAPAFDLDVFSERLELVLADLVREGIRTGELREGDVEAMTLALLGGLTIALETHLSFPDRTMGRASVDRILTQIFDGLTGEPGRARATRRRSPSRRFRR